MKLVDRRPNRVLCVDDDGMLAAALKTTFKRTPGFQWVGHLDDADDLAQSALDDCPDIVLLDIHMPGKDAFDALEELLEVCPDARAIILSGYVNQRLIDRAIEAGAWGFISKYDANPALLAAIKRVAGGEFVLSDAAKASYANSRF
jgi:two-component system response regulator DesR